MAAGISAGIANWWLISRRPATPPEPVRKAGAVIAKAAGRVRPARGAHLPGHWLDATEADTQPIPVIRDDWTDEHAAAAAETFDDMGARRAGGTPKIPDIPRKPAAKRRAPSPPPKPRTDIVDETDDRGGHVIYVDPYAWDRD
ncbi:hypothetical protein [Microbispora sp. GKU 823]|uniref:hypothetical protein n=1 Tax=Microbispora sp. GKU 823 TaxID=1652100 RepID=UPI00211859DC|nr:hypothetical protein [Microbispora sp. GKU 823]